MNGKINRIFSLVTSSLIEKLSNRLAIDFISGGSIINTMKIANKIHIIILIRSLLELSIKKCIKNRSLKRP